MLLNCTHCPFKPRRIKQQFDILAIGLSWVHQHLYGNIKTLYFQAGLWSLVISRDSRKSQGMVMLMHITPDNTNLWTGLAVKANNLLAVALYIFNRNEKCINILIYLSAKRQISLKMSTIPSRMQRYGYKAVLQQPSLFPHSNKICQD